MGSDKKKDMLAFDDEMPQHTLHLPSYRIACAGDGGTICRVHCGQPGISHHGRGAGLGIGIGRARNTRRSRARTGRTRGPQSDVRAKQDHPVTCVSWHDAVAFCTWAGVRLPTEAEWEKAASWAEGRKLLYPWGNREPNIGVCNFKMTVGDTTPVDRYPDGKSPFGVLDMAGNVWEWTSSLWAQM